MRTRPISDLLTEAKPARESDAQRRARAFGELVKYLQVCNPIEYGSQERHLILPLAPSLLNGNLARATWPVIRAAKHQYATQCKILLSARLIPAPPAAPWSRVVMVATIYSTKARDEDSISHYLKMPNDFLKGERGYFEDDNPACLTLERVTQERCGQTPPRVVIEMRQVLGGVE